MKMKIYIILVLVILNSCCQTSKTTLENKAISRKDTIGEIIYNIKDTTSVLFISHHECTECKDARVDSGIIYLPDSVSRKIIKLNNEENIVCAPNDLYLTGPTKINETLFGDSLNFLEHRNDEFKIKGTAIDIVNGVNGHAILFRIDNYEKCKYKRSKASS
jgi:hypothetical protein